MEESAGAIALAHFSEESPPEGFEENAMNRFVFSAALLALPALASAQALNLKDVPDDARATIIKEMTRKNIVKQQQGTQGTDANDDMFGPPRPGSKGGGCNMDVGSQDQPSRAQRRTITVVTGPIVQICK
jgi:hypothetical protein